MAINHYSGISSIFNFFSEILIYCSGARSSILKMSVCSAEREKYSKIGLIILLVSLSAFVSFSYAAWTVIHDRTSMLFGLWGALFIFSIDRTIVAESVKTGDTKKKYFLFLFVRLFLAIIISFVITVPIHLLVFSGPINNYLDSQNQLAALTMDATLQAQYPQIQILKERNIKLEDELKNFREERTKAQEQMTKEGTGQKGVGLTGKLGTGLSYDLKKNEFEDKNNQYEAQKKKIESEISDNLKEIAEQEGEFNQKKKNSDKIRADNNSLPTQMSALHDISKDNHTINVASWGITLLFVGLDSAPVFLKILSRRGIYDVISERMDKEIINNEDEELKTALLLINQKAVNQRKKDNLILKNEHEIFLEIETANKDKLLQAIMDIHEQSMNTDEWKNAYDNVISDYVKSMSNQLSNYSRSFQLSEREFDHYVRPELIKTARKYVQPIAEEEMKRRRVSSSKDSLLKQLEKKFRETMKKW
jgi:hypothetical protein